MPVALVTGANRGHRRRDRRRSSPATTGSLVIAGARDPVAGRGGRQRARASSSTSPTTTRSAPRSPGSRRTPARLDVLINNAGVYGDPTGAGRLRPRRRAPACSRSTSSAPGGWPRRRCRCCARSDVAADRQRLERQRPARRDGHRLRRLPPLEGGAERAHPHARRRGAARSRSTRSARAGCGPTWAARSAPRSVAEGADTAVWLATRPSDVPTGGFFRDRKPIPW